MLGAIYDLPTLQNQPGDARRQGELSGEVCLGKHPCLENRLGEHTHLSQFRGFKVAFPGAPRFQSRIQFQRKMNSLTGSSDAI